MTTHDLAHGIRALEAEIAARTLAGTPGLVPLARAMGQMRRELVRRAGWAMLLTEPGDSWTFWVDWSYCLANPPFFGPGAK